MKKPTSDLILDPAASARFAGLRYVTDAGPGLRRKRAGKHFAFVATHGSPIRDAETLNRIARLVIPPAWTSVWICPIANGHIQATGRDAKGRKQYRYHARWREVRDETKYGKMVAFGRALPKVRVAVGKDLARPGLPREKVLATVVRLLEATNIRVGNEEYARKNRSFGLTTMRDYHVDVDGTKLAFHFRGKSGKEHRIGIRDRRLARIVERCSELPGHELFQYVDEEGAGHSIESTDVNEYLHAIAGDAFTAKDFRTWSGTVLAARALRECQPAAAQAARSPGPKELNKHIVAAIKNVAARLGNTSAVCRKCYVHPAIFDAYLDGHLVGALKARSAESLIESPRELRAAEAAVITLLQTYSKDRLARPLQKRVNRAVA